MSDSSPSASPPSSSEQEGSRIKPPVKSKTSRATATNTSSSSKPALTPGARVIKGRGDRGAGDGKNTNTSAAPKSLSSSLAPIVVHPLPSLKRDECRLTQDKVRQLANKKRGPCNCMACGGDVSHHDEGEIRLQKLPDDFDTDDELDSARTYQTRGGTVHHRRDDRRRADKRASATSRDQGSGDNHRNDDVEADSGSGTTREKSSKRNRTHHSGNDDDRRRSDHVDSTSRRGRREKVVETTADIYKRVKAAQSKVPLGDTEKEAQRIAREKRAAQRREPSKDANPKKSNDKGSDKTGEKGSEKPPAKDKNDVDADDSRNDNGGDDTSGKIYYLFYITYMPVRLIRTGTKDSQVYTSWYKTRYDFVKNYHEKDVPDSVSIERNKIEMKIDQEAWSKRKYASQSNRDKRAMIERAEKCYKTYDQLRAFPPTEETLSVESKCDVCECEMNIHRKATHCALSDAEVLCQIEQISEFRCSICYCLSDDHNAHDPNEQGVFSIVQQELLDKAEKRLEKGKSVPQNNQPYEMIRTDLFTPLIDADLPLVVSGIIDPDTSTEEKKILFDRTSKVFDEINDQAPEDKDDQVDPKEKGRKSSKDKNKNDKRKSSSKDDRKSSSKDKNKEKSKSSKRRRDDDGDDSDDDDSDDDDKKKKKSSKDDKNDKPRKRRDDKKKRDDDTSEEDDSDDDSSSSDDDDNGDNSGDSDHSSDDEPSDDGDDDDSNPSPPPPPPPSQPGASLPCPYCYE